MAKKKKKQKKSGTSKKRAKRYQGPAKGTGPDETAGSGAMQGMVSGFRRAVGVETEKKKTWVDHVWTILLLLAVAGILFWRFGSGD
ncbi:MAG: hypothetical protein AAGE52_20160 [Myxococcota bacterium]